jgi:hypothetical protein
MAQTHTVKAAQKAQRCNTCGQPIEVGQSYKWFKMKLARGGVKKSYHPGCNIPPSHRTTSRMGQIWDAQEVASNGIFGAESLADIEAELQSFAEAVRSVGEEYTESADNIESGFGHETFQSTELRERGEALDSWADDLENWEFTGDEEPDEETYEPENEDDDTFEDAHQAWLDNVQQEASGEVDNCPV